MEFLVRIEVRPLDVDKSEEQALRAQEREVGQRYRQEGALVRIWRIPGRRATVSLWKATDATELHDLLSGFPLFPWMDIKVTALARHYLEAEDDGR